MASFTTAALRSHEGAAYAVGRVFFNALDNQTTRKGLAGAGRYAANGPHGVILLVCEKVDDHQDDRGDS